MIEPFLIQQGLIQRTPRGRVVTDKGYRHVGQAERADARGRRLSFPNLLLPEAEAAMMHDGIGFPAAVSR